MEQWRQLEDYPLYEVNSEGLVRNVRTGVVIRYRMMHGLMGAAIGPKCARRTITQDWMARAFITGSVESAKLSTKERSARMIAGAKPQQQAKWDATHAKVLDAWNRGLNAKQIREELGCGEHCVYLHLKADGISAQQRIRDMEAAKREEETAAKAATKLYAETFRDMKGEQLELFPNTCQTCGRPMPGNDNARYCSDDCRPKYVAKRDISHVCVDCGVRYFHRKGDGSSFDRCDICEREHKKKLNREYKRTHKMPSDIGGGFNSRARKACRKYGGHYEPVNYDSIFERDGWFCYRCGVALKRGPFDNSPDSATLDHVWPLAKGGDHAPYNLKPCCFACNSEKSAKLPEEVA